MCIIWRAEKYIWCQTNFLFPVLTSVVSVLLQEGNPEEY